MHVKDKIRTCWTNMQHIISFNTKFNRLAVMFPLLTSMPMGKHAKFL